MGKLPAIFRCSLPVEPPFEAGYVKQHESVSGLRFEHRSTGSG